MSGLSSVFEPRRVALVGASDQPGKVGSLLWSNLATFSGEVIPVTSSADQVGGRPAYPTLGDIDGDVDLAVLAVPASAVPDLVRQAGDKRIGGVVVLSGGFAETGPDGEALQAELARAAREGGVRVVGPNCFGVQNAHLSLNASIAAGAGTDAGGISLITQSGAYGMAIHAMGSDEQVRFAKIYASGNKVDIGDHEVIEYLRDDPETDIICVFAESVGNGRALTDAIRSASPAKPVVITKTGRSEAGSRAARSHTGSLASNDVIFRAAMKSASAIVARSGLEMLDVARVMQGQALPAGSRAAIITNSGGTGVELVDMLADEGIDVPELSDALRAEIAERLPAFASAANPVDMTPVWPRFAELYPWLVNVLARSGEVDFVIPILLQRSAMDIETVEAVAAEVVGLRADGVAVPVYVCWVAPRGARPNADALQRFDIPCLEWPDRTARAIGHAVRYARERELLESRAAVPPAIDGLESGPMEAVDAERLLTEFGIPVAVSSVCSTADEAVGVSNGIGYPVVMKVADAEIAHRSDIGGVRTGVADAIEVRDVFGELGEHSAQVLVQMQVSGTEIMVGGVNDPSFGPMVMVGLGGVLVELIGDVNFAPAPVSVTEARQLIGELSGNQVLSGFRGSEPVDVVALAELVSAASRLLATYPEISELDLNPVMVTSDGAVAVDWKINVN